MADWSRVATTTIANYIKGAEVNVLRQRKLLAMCKSAGRISFNWAGTKMVWDIEHKEAPLEGYADGSGVSFQPRDRWKQLELGWRSYQITDAMTKGEQLKNRGAQAMINVFEGIGKRLVRDLNSKFGQELYKDGEAAGNTLGIHGIESFLGVSGTVSDGLVGNPSDTFANQSTALGGSGSWSGTWPSGTGTTDYDWFSPLVVDYTNALWPAATDTWANNATDALRFGILYANKNESPNGMLSVVLLERELYRAWLTQLDEKTRIMVRASADNSTLVKLGFTDVQNFDGTDITTEFGIPSGVGYGFNVNEMELRSQQAQLFLPDEPDYDKTTKTHRFGADFWGNVCWNPRYFVAFKPVT